MSRVSVKGKKTLNASSAQSKVCSGLARPGVFLTVSEVWFAAQH